MSVAILLKINRFIQRIENVLPQMFGRGFPPGKIPIQYIIATIYFILIAL